ncbi:hypothetical protein EDB80DRAFT_594580, partial [Ilyonectria destructans]
AHPRGYFFTTLPSYLYLLKALIITFIGVINPVIYYSYIRSYLLTTTHFNKHILTSFYTYISVLGYINRAYTNCI